MRPDITNAVSAVAPEARDTSASAAYLNKMKDLGPLLVFEKVNDVKLSVYVDADYANNDNGRNSGSGVAVVVGGTFVNVCCTTQHCATLSTGEAEYVAMVQGDEIRAMHESRVGFPVAKVC